MTQYEVEFEYSIPEFGSVVVDANSHEDAETMAMERIEDLFPEAIDVVVIKVAKLGV